MLKNINNIKNIKIIEKAIGDKNEYIYYNGDLNHVTFSTNKKLNKLKSITLDILLDSNLINNIGFIHLDVEGFEYKVIEGAKKLITIHKPIITTESHKGDKEIQLRKYGYNEYIIPEICGLNSSCRNSLWIPEHIRLNNNIKKLLNLPLHNHITINSI